MTVIDICNNALADIGHDREITSLDPSADTSSEARRCALFYPRALSDVIHAHPWRFITQTVPGDSVLVTTVDPLPGFESVYAPPAQAAAIQSAIDETGDPVPYTMQDGLIHARRDVDTFAFTSADLAADPSLWPPPFAEAVIAALALRLARVITGSDAAAKTAAQAYAQAIAAARRHDRMTSSSTPGESNPYLSARAATSDQSCS